MRKVFLSGVVYSMAVLSLSVLAPSPVLAQPSEAEAKDRRRNIRYMEGVLVQAIRVGAEQVSKELERYDPNAVSALLGTPRARGFVLEGHGVFFDVEVPDMDQSFAASVVLLQRERQMGSAADSLRAALRTMPEGQGTQQVQTALQFLVASGIKDPAVLATPPQTPIASPPLIFTEPRKFYRAAMIDSVVDAMLAYSVQMNLGPEEWLTVAARGIEPSGPLQGLQETTTITVRVKGADLAIYHSDPARRAEIREKVKADAKVF